MTQRIVETEQDRLMLLRFLSNHKLPMTVQIEEGKHRSTAQNKLQRQWIKELAEQLPQHTAEEWRGLCKLQFGVPILRHENETFCAAYDAHVKPLPYEQKLAFMMEPLDFPVTRLMTTKQKTNYLDAIYRHFSEQGVVLTDPAQHGVVFSEREAA